MDGGVLEPDTIRLRRVPALIDRLQLATRFLSNQSVAGVCFQC